MPVLSQEQVSLTRFATCERVVTSPLAGPIHVLGEVMRVGTDTAQ